MPACILVLIGFLISGCAPHFYKGRMAFVAIQPYLIVEAELHDAGDCHKSFGKLPITYVLDRHHYKINIAHTDRYWAELYFEAYSTSGEKLGLRSKHLSPTIYRFGANGAYKPIPFNGVFNYTSGKLLGESGSLDFEVLDSEGDVLGNESVSFLIQEVSCFEWDSL